MTGRRILRLAAAIPLAALLYVSARPVGPLPALGRLLDPANGIWGVARNADLPLRANADVPGLGAEVRVLYDARGVPHIFASTEEDATRALGYVVARDRLFQLEIQTLATAGRLTEFAGARAIELDREQRRLGLAASAEREWAAVDSASHEGRLVRAFADGVNAWIDGLKPAEYPIEYHLLSAKPSRWLPQYSYYLMKRMGYTLAYGQEDRTYEALVARLGAEKASQLRPIDNAILEPIVPGRGAGRQRGREAGVERGAGSGTLSVAAGPPAPQGRVEGLGSNNWAVAPSRSASGHALLAGDPHLSLTLPSIWYEVHVKVGEGSKVDEVDEVKSDTELARRNLVNLANLENLANLDVYGVTIPGAPGVIIGFNRDIAWTFTNGGADVLDYYEETLDDTLKPARYKLDGEWKAVEQRIEVYRGPRGDVIATDTFYATHRGPLIRDGSRALSMRWTVLEPNGTVEAFARIARARNVDEWMAGMEGYHAPIQNGLVADRQGNIAIRATGNYPIRPGDGTGVPIRDGSLSASDWKGFLPLSRQPFARNPRQGFLASANQQPVDPRDDPTYFGTWETPWRALRINTLLRADSSVTVDEMRQFQTDPGSARADLFVAAFLAAADGQRGREAERQGDAGRVQVTSPTSSTSQTSASPELSQAAALLAQWDKLYTRDNTRALLFEHAMDELASRTWDELRTSGETREGFRRRMFTPPSDVLGALLREPSSPWWDDRSTDAVERRDDILRASLAAAYQKAIDRYVDPLGTGWRWDRVRHANIHHLLRLAPFSALALPIQGGPSTLNPSSGDGNHGASWRMVVELGPEVRAWAIYPGGQSGNPVSSRYRDRLDKWLAGELDSLVVPRSPDERQGPWSALLRLSPRRQ